METQVKDLQTQIKFLKIAMLILFAITALLLTSSFTFGKEDILRAKGIIIEGNDGKPFIVMGNPLPQLKNRIRKDEMRGIAFIDDKGVDRLFIGKDGKLQMGGELVERNSEGWSYMINEATGDERGGFGFSDDENRIGLGLDYGGKDGLEAIYLSASDSISYITLNGNVKTGHRDRIVLWQDTGNDLSLIKIGDKIHDNRLVLKASAGKANITERNTQGKYNVLTEK